MMIHGVKLEECSELGVKMTFPDNSYCTLAIDVVGAILALRVLAPTIFFSASSPPAVGIR